MYVGKYDLDRRTGTGVDPEVSLQGAAKPFDQAHPQRFPLAGSAISGQPHAIVCDPQAVFAPQCQFKDDVDPPGRVLRKSPAWRNAPAPRKGVFHGIGNGFVYDQAQRDSLCYIQLDGIEVQVKDKVVIGCEAITQKADDLPEIDRHLDIGNLLVEEQLLVDQGDRLYPVLTLLDLE